MRLRRFPEREAHLRDRRERHHAGGMDHRVDSPEAFGSDRDQPAHVVLVGDVATGDGSRAACRLDRGRGFVGAGPPPAVVHQDVHAGDAKAHCDRAAYPTRSTGHDRHSVLVLEHQILLLGERRDGDPSHEHMGLRQPV